MKRTSKIVFFLIILLGGLAPIQIGQTTGNRVEVIDLKDKMAYIQYFGIYDDLPQISLTSMHEAIQVILDKGSVELTTDEVIDLIGLPSETVEVGQSKFLTYYSITDSESLQMSLQFFAEEDDFLLRLMDVQSMSHQTFIPIKISDNKIDALLMGKHYEDLIDMLGNPSGFVYNFKTEQSQLNWIRDSVTVSGIYYLEVDLESSGHVAKVNYAD